MPHIHTSPGCIAYRVDWYERVLSRADAKRETVLALMFRATLPHFY